jgi:hypothetical protein
MVVEVIFTDTTVIGSGVAVTSTGPATTVPTPGLNSKLLGADNIKVPEKAPPVVVILKSFLKVSVRVISPSVTYAPPKHKLPPPLAGVTEV